ncbi:MAG: 3-hydroxybutyryl-CoA dehydrogenase [Firmicutes bacterium]|nr:3-hydroxybutyryl-CoA dehydrogenase [Bacillota bacterium]
MRIKNVFVIGAGFMGSGIVENVAAKGLPVAVYDVNVLSLMKCEANIKKRIENQVFREKISEEEGEEILNRISYVHELEECREYDLVIEAATENKDLKVSILQDVEKYVGIDAIIATNTSSISITALAAKLRRPERFLGLHFFSPVPKMRLLELVKGYQTGEEVLEQGQKFAHFLGKKYVTSNDEAGFIVNRMLLPMLNQAVVLVERHVSTIEEIDMAAKLGMNHPMGPLELLDMIGLDVELAVMETIHRETGDSRYRPSVSLRRMVDAGYLGRKTGVGFYIYDEEGNKTPNIELQNRL